MRTIKSTSVFALILSLFIAATSFAAIPNVEYFDFSGWDASLIDNGPGQTFNVADGVNVTVQGFGDFTTPSLWNGASFMSGHLQSGDRNQFHLTFDTSLPLVIKTATVDANEQVELIGVGPETYVHLNGAAPLLSDVGTSGIEIQGAGFGVGAGAAAGETMTFAQQNLAVIVRHDSLFNNKYEFFRVGTTVTVPEPNSIALIGLGAIGLVMSGRKRRNR